LLVFRFIFDRFFVPVISELLLVVLVERNLEHSQASLPSLRSRAVNLRLSAICALLQKPNSLQRYLPLLELSRSQDVCDGNAV